MSLVTVALVGAAVTANLVVGAVVFSFHPKSATSRLFFFLTIIAAAWTWINYLSTHQSTSEATLVFARLELAAASLYSFAVLLTVHVFPSSRFHFNRRLLILIAAGTVITISLTQTPLFFKSLEGTGTQVLVTPGPAIPLFGIYNFAILLSILISFYRKVRSSHGQLRAQLQYLSIAIIASYCVAFFTNFVLVNIFRITSLLPVAPYLSLIFVLVTGYATVAHRLFDIKIIIRRTIVYTGLLLLIFGAYSLIVLVGISLLQSLGTGNVRNSFNPTSLGINLVAAIFISMSFEPLRKWLQERTDRWLFKKEYEQQSVIKDLGKKLNDVVALDEALETVMQTITRVLHLRHAVTYVFQPGEDKTMAIKRVKQIGYNSSARLLLEERDFTVQYFSQYPATRLYEDLKNEVEREQELIEHNRLDPASIRLHAIKVSVLKKLKSLDVSVAIPLQLNSQPIGLILLSEKLSGEAYSPQDLTLLELVGGQAISSIQKAKLYEGDQMKSEFVSIASHELLTPISAMEGYLSMILDENIGKIDNQARDYLTKVYTSAKRLSELIKDLLSVSRIESGKMKVDLQQLDIAKMINDTIDQLRFVAANKNLTVTYRKPSDPLPAVWADPDRTMQIMVNLVSNAIKYTPKGEVTITSSVDKANEFVTVSVTDTGLGMSKAQMSHLFTKFYRVDTPQTTGIMGTGLGLYITKTLIEKMGGSITCKSEVGKGTTFTFSLPVFKVETSTAS